MPSSPCHGCWSGWEEKNYRKEGLFHSFLDVLKMLILVERLDKMKIQSNRAVHTYRYIWAAKTVSIHHHLQKRQEKEPAAQQLYNAFSRTVVCHHHSCNAWHAVYTLCLSQGVSSARGVLSIGLIPRIQPFTQLFVSTHSTTIWPATTDWK